MCDLANTPLVTRIIKKDRIRDKITDFELQLIDTVHQFQVDLSPRVDLCNREGLMRNFIRPPCSLSCSMS
jgi:hypothetical protein